MHSKMLFMVTLLFSIYGVSVWADDVAAVKFESLPDAVKKTAMAYMDIAHISSLSKITENDQVKFELKADKVENKKDIIAQDMLIASNGKIIRLVQEVPYFALSYEQMQEIEKHYPNIKVNEVQSVETHYFNVLGQVHQQNVQFKITDDGIIEENQTSQ